MWGWEWRVCVWGRGRRERRGKGAAGRGSRSVASDTGGVWAAAGQFARTVSHGHCSSDPMSRQRACV